MGCAEGITRERERERGGGVGVERESELWKKLAADELTSFVECPLAAIPASVSAMDAVDPTRRAMHNDTSGAMSAEDMGWHYRLTITPFFLIV